MTPQQFAEALRKIEQAHEASWIMKGELTGHYAKSYSDCAIETVGDPWARIMSVLLYPGYADVWDWCDEQLGAE